MVVSGELASGEKRLVNVEEGRKADLKPSVEVLEKAWPTWSPRKFVKQLLNGPLNPRRTDSVPRFPALALVVLDCWRGDSGSEWSLRCALLRPDNSMQHWPETLLLRFSGWELRW